MDPHQLALQLKPQLEAKGYTVDAQGNVRYPPNGSGIFPPWSWMQAFPDADVRLKTPGSDPTSAWHSMYQEGGPFKHGSQWDQGKGTYEGGINWGDLLLTIGAGSVIGGGVAAAAGGAGGGGGAATTLGSVYPEAGEGGLGLVGAPAAVAPAAASGAIPAAFGKTAVDTVSSAAPSATGGVVKALGGYPSIIGSVISTAGNLWGAKNASDASMDAAQIQANAAKYAADLYAKASGDALDFQKKQWDTTQQNMAPWLNTGKSALTTLGSLMGLQPGGGGPVSAASWSNQGGHPVMAPPLSPLNAGPPQQGAPQRPMTMGQMFAAPNGAQRPMPPMAQPGAPSQPAIGGGPNFVRITWPDGSNDTVPRNTLQQYQLLGAQVN